jgi:hypothetical protein
MSKIDLKKARDLGYRVEITKDQGAVYIYGNEKGNNKIIEALQVVFIDLNEVERDMVIGAAMRSYNNALILRVVS